MAVLQALAAAVMFGLSPPLAKLLLTSASPLVLAGLLYLGAGLFLTVARVAVPSARQRGRPLARRDWWALTGAVVAGGLLAPPLLLWGLDRSPASATALLLNLEVVFTTILAGVVFREPLGVRVALAAVLVALGGTAVSWRGGSLDMSLAAVAVAGACALWALDNNLTRLVAEVDAALLAQVKGLAAGAVNLGLAGSLGHPLPPPTTVLLGLALGALSYGSSLVLLILAMRELGAARAAAYFAVAPFVGALAGVLLLGEHVSGQFLLAAGLIAAGVGTLVAERHRHPHRHPADLHTHRHVHDVHHQHVHQEWEGPEPHVHPHPTGPLQHEHRHTPDLHHPGDH